MNIKAMILATLNDSGPCDMETLEGALHAGEVKSRQVPVALHTLIWEAKVKVDCGIYSAAQ